MSMRTSRSTIGAVAAGLAVAASVAVPATSASAQPAPGPGTTLPGGLTWEPYRSQPFQVAAGQRCAFPVAGEPVKDEEQIATLATFSDGSPRHQVITGDLRFRYTNLDTGASVEHDLNGTGFIEYGTDGSMVQRLVGAAAVGFRATDRFPKGIWALDGYHEVYFAPDGGYREIRVDAGTEHNVCTDLD
ncbi:hypothetical protein [Micromonospora sp. DT47]|uniref:hypothetical protein n=1 Tax=Micromonospora sp. DT47 TaxID=3393431 RepID=UPI003CE817F5